MSISDCTFAATVTFTVPAALMLALKSAAPDDRFTEEAPAVDSHPVDPVQSTIRFVQTGRTDVDSLFAWMLEYQKLASKEAAADREAWRSDEKLVRELRAARLVLEAAKLDLDNAMIGQMMEEAAERADRATCAATAAILSGSVPGVSTSAAGSGKIAARSQKNVLMADHLQREITKHEEEIKKAEKCAAESRDAYDAASARKSIAADNIQKFLDTLRSTNPQI